MCRAQGFRAVGGEAFSWFPSLTTFSILCLLGTGLCVYVCAEHAAAMVLVHLRLLIFPFGHFGTVQCARLFYLFYVTLCTCGRSPSLSLPLVSVFVRSVAKGRPVLFSGLSFLIDNFLYQKGTIRSGGNRLKEGIPIFSFN